MSGVVGQHTGDHLDLRDTVRISEDDTDLRRGSTLLCELADLVDNLLGGGLQPRRRNARVWDSRGRYAFSVAVKTTHDCGLVFGMDSSWRGAQRFGSSSREN